VNSLTEKERIGLDEVFLSISSHSRLSLLSRVKNNLHHTLYKVREKTLFSFKNRVKMPKIGHFSSKNHKKKKFLS
jgi:hypothetical protein